MSAEEGKKPGGTRTCLTIGCVILAIFGIVAIVGGFWLASNFRRISSDFVYEGISRGIEETSLEEEQRTSILADMARVRDAFQREEVSFEELGELMEVLSDGPLIHVGVVTFVQQSIIEPSDLSEDEKADGHVQLDRVARGAFEGEVSIDDVERILEPVNEKAAQSREQQGLNLSLKSDPTPEEVRDVIERAREVADAAEVAAQPAQVDVAAEFRKAVDAVLE